MKITALLVLKCNPEGSDPVILANALDVSHFGYFQRSSVKEFIVFVGRTVAKRTPPSQRQSVQHEGSALLFPISPIIIIIIIIFNLF
jgi:synaptobrevin family protein YKT6